MLGVSQLPTVIFFHVEQGGILYGIKKRCVKFLFVEVGFLWGSRRQSWLMGCAPGDCNGLTGNKTL